MDKRLDFLDSLKALGICLVILYHCGYSPWNSLFIRGIYAICVPLFFVVNGFLMLRKEYSIRKLLLKNLKLLFVLFFWAFVSTAITMYTLNEWGNGFDSIKTFFVKSIYIAVPYSNHLWFLKAIFVLNILNPILYSFIHGRKKRVNYLVLILFLCTAQFFNRVVKQFINPMMGWPYAVSVLYYVLGYAIYSDSFRLNRIKTKYIVISILGLSIFQWIYNWILLEGPLSSMNSEKGYVMDPVWDGYKAPFIVFLTVAVFLFYKKKRNWNNAAWQYIGKNSLPIYLMQSPMIKICRSTTIYKELVTVYYPLRVILPIVTLLICVLLTWVFNKNKCTKWLISI